VPQLSLWPEGVSRVNTPPDKVFVSRGGWKLQHALSVFGLNPAGFRCADFGCSTGGFTDCLLQAGAERVWAVDTGYGVLAWRLRHDPRVRVLERTNALHAPVPEELRAAGGADLVVIDAGWTPQRLAVPAALGWLCSTGRIITLIKPHYEDRGAASRHRGVLPDAEAAEVVRGIIDQLPDQVLAACGRAVRVVGLTESPLRGGRGSTREGQGNAEWLALIAQAPEEPARPRRGDDPR
jgi:23S rRNA (cytidine1920-2'-O)/16S rRNA (cytidine1409-2'-O)-methyltransferase